MNTNTGLTVLAITASLSAVAACGTERPAAHPQGALARQSATRAAQDAYVNGRLKRTRAQVEQPSACRISPVLIEKWGHGVTSPRDCMTLRIKAQHFGDDRRMQR
jgi:hypothetical protein